MRLREDAWSQSAVSELLEAFRAGDGVDPIRESVRTVLQELIEAEAAEVIGAGRCERTENRTTEGNGHRPRVLTTRTGEDPQAEGRVVLRLDPAARCQRRVKTDP